MKSIVRRDTGEDWKAYLTRLMQEEGLIEQDDEPTDEELRRFDKQRKDKKVSNEEWAVPTDPDSRIAKMKDGTTHLAYKAEHVVDLESELILAAEIYHADQGDTTRWSTACMEAQVASATKRASQTTIEEVAADKGYHAAETLELAETLNSADVHPRAAAQASLAMDRQAAGAARRPCTPIAGGRSARQEQAAAAAAQRTGGAHVRPRLRDGRRAAHLAARHREGPQAVPDRGRWRGTWGR